MKVAVLVAVLSTLVIWQSPPRADEVITVKAPIRTFAGQDGTGGMRVRFRVPPHKDNRRVHWILETESGTGWGSSLPLNGAEERHLVTWDVSYRLPIGRWKLFAEVRGEAEILRGRAEISGEVQ